MNKQIRCLWMVGLTGISWTMFSAATLAGTGDTSKVILDDKNVELSKKSESIWKRSTLTGDWGGTRDKLADKGITFFFANWGDFLTDVSGNQTHHATYFGRFRGNVDIDFKKLADVDGHFFVSGIYQYGRNLSGDYLNVFTSTSSIAGEESLRLDQIWYEQGFIDSKVKLKFGQVAAVNEFGATDFFDILMSDETGYSANINFRANQSFSPAGKPGVVMTVDLSDFVKGLYVKGGGFTARGNDPYHPDDTGLHWNDNFSAGATGSAEVGYYDPSENYAGVYKVGMTYNDLHGMYTDLRTGKQVEGNYVAYFTAEKSVYHPEENGKLNKAKGLDLLFQFFGAPEDRNPVRFETLLGARYTGLIPTRDQDKLGFGFVYADASTGFSRNNEAAGGNNLNGEYALELTYQYQVTPWFQIQPNTQFIVDPRGDDSRGDIVVLGLRTIVTF